MRRGIVWSQRLGLLVGSLVIALGGLELGFRWFRWHRLTMIELEDDPVYHHRLKPHATFHQTSPDFQSVATTNSLGLRGPVNYGPKPSGVRRLLMLGDSFVFGVGVNDDQTFCALLQQAFDRRGATVEVINAGLGGYSPILAYLALRDLYLPLEPDGVILWFEFGDLQEDFFYQGNLRYGPDGQVIACHPSYREGRFDWASYLRERSALWKYFHNKFVRTYEKIRILGLVGYLKVKLRGERAKAAIATLKDARRRPRDLLEYDRFLMIRGPERLPEIRQHWDQRTGQNILRIRDLLRQRGIPFALAAFPHGVQVGPDQWGKGRQPYGFQAGVVYDGSYAFELLEEFARANDLPFLNTYPAFLAARDHPLFFDWDGHFTPAGHRVVARYLTHDPAARAFLARLR